MTNPVADVPSVDLGALYRAARERISALVTAPGVDPAATVPATPEWSVHDVVAHVSGVAVDGTSGNMAGAPGDEWTAAQVARNVGRPIEEMVAEWSEVGPLMEGFLSSPSGAMASAAVMDIHTHEADLRHALGLPIAVPAEFLAWAGPSMRNGFAEAVAGAGLPPVSVDASAFEWFRGRLGRRTAAEVAAYDWSASAADYLDTFFIFGRAAQSLGEIAEPAA
ncbi:MAG: maleylpyruvate isomerase N-terminal domain-containing protein [Ilumatobacteraceae bacterium]